MCSACRLGKHTRLPFQSSSSFSLFPFQTLHLDVWTSPVVSISGYQFYLVVLDDYTHYAWTFPLKHKSEIFSILTEFFAYVQTQFQLPILALQTDNGREFDNHTVRALLARHGTHFRLSCPYTSQQNGKAERTLRTLNDGLRALLFHASMPPRFWAEALSTSTYLLNRRPCHSTAPRSPHEMLLGVPPDYSFASLVASASPTSPRPRATNLIADPLRASSLGTPQTTAATGVSIPPLAAFSLPGM